MRFETGRLVARLAETPADIARAQALRHLCFVAARGLARTNAREADAFDPLCQHVLIEDRTGQILAGFRYRVLPAARICESYSAQFYDLARLSTLSAPVLELGRFCIHPAGQDPEILRLAWALLTRLVEENAIALLFGCTSFAGADPALHAVALAHLARHVAPSALAPGRKGQAVDLPAQQTDPRAANTALPPLLRSYLAMGGWVSDHAVIDRDLDTLHVFTAVEVARIPPARARALRALAG